MTTADQSKLLNENQQLRQRNAELEEELRQANSQITNMEHLYERAPVGLGVVNSDLRFVGVNERLAVFNGHSVEEHIGAHISEIVPQIEHAISPIFEEIIRTGEPSLGFEMSGESPVAPGKISTFLVSCFPVKEAADVTTGVAIVVQDTTELKRTQESLQQAHDELEERVEQRTEELARSEERWRSLVDTAPDLILTVNPDQTIRYINRATQGFTKEEMIGAPTYAFTTPEYHDAVVEAHQSVFQTGEVKSLQFPVPGKDGRIEWYQTRIGPYLEGDEITGVTCIATNITRRKRAEEKNRTERKLLQRLLDFQENERRMVAHDIHDGFVQYAVGAHMCVQGIADRVEGDDDLKSAFSNIGTYLQRAIEEGRRMIGHLRPMVLDEKGVVEAIKHLIADDVETKGLSVRFEHDVKFDLLEPMLEGAIFRIVQESLNNIRQHSQCDNATVQLIQHHDILKIVVRDRGVGFDVRNVSPERFGLRGIRERARLFRGSAMIQSVPGKGTIVQLTLPVGEKEE